MSLGEIEQLITARAPGRGVATAVPRQYLSREDAAMRDVDLAYRPLLCFVVTGAKTTTAGRLTSRVSSGEMFLSQLELPVVAAYQPPYRSVTLDIDETLLTSVLAEVVLPRPAQVEVTTVIQSTEMDDGLVSAVARWVALGQEPELIASLAPLLEQEILIRVLRSPLGPGLRRSIAGGPMAAMRDLAALLSRHAPEPVAVDALASRAGVSSATLFRHFRAATGMSPGQYQKVTRLQQARRLLAAGSHTASAAAIAVGYVSVPQFSRDYRKRYGVPPGRDAQHLRAGLSRSGSEHA